MSHNNSRKVQPFDLHGLRTYDLQSRPSKVFVEDAGKPVASDATVAGWIDSLPRQLAGNDIRAAHDDVPRTVAVHRVGAWRKAVGRAALGRLPAHLANSRERFARLAERLAAEPALRVHLPVAGAQPSATCLFVTLPFSPASAALIRRLWASRLGVTRMFSRAIVDYPALQVLVQATETPHARALAATTLTLSTDASFTPGAEAAVLSVLRDLPRMDDRAYRRSPSPGAAGNPSGESSRSLERQSARR